MQGTCGSEYDIRFIYPVTIDTKKHLGDEARWPLGSGATDNGIGYDWSLPLGVVGKAQGGGVSGRLKIKCCAAGYRLKVLILLSVLRDCTIFVGKKKNIRFNRPDLLPG